MTIGRCPCATFLSPHWRPDARGWPRFFICSVSDSLMRKGEECGVCAAGANDNAGDGDAAR